jgi:starvation-inducible DNA-binding protein
MPPRLFPTRHDLPADNRRDLIALLNAHVADLADLRSQTKYAHWNVKGPTFIALHELFDDLADKLDGLTDTAAERATTLGGVALGTVRQAAAASRLPEFPSQTFAGLSVVEALAVRVADVGKSAREAIDKADTLGDAASADLFTAATRELDQALYFLEAHLQG